MCLTKRKNCIIIFEILIRNNKELNIITREEEENTLKYYNFHNNYKQKNI